jgi:hypothetical protein
MAPMRRIRSLRLGLPIREDRAIRCFYCRTNKANFREGPGGNALRRHYERGAERAKQSQLTEVSAMRRFAWTPAFAGVTRGRGVLYKQTQSVASDCAKQSQSAGGYPIVPSFQYPPPEPVVETKPISGQGPEETPCGVTTNAGAERAKRSQLTGASAMRRLIWTPASAGVTKRGAVVQTKPIGRIGYPSIPLFHHSSIPVPTLAHKQSQKAVVGRKTAVQTKPNRAKRDA